MGYFIFIFAALTLLGIAEITRRQGFKKLNISRSIDKHYLNPGEEFRITTTVENNKWLPISFLYVEEEIPSEIEKNSSEIFNTKGNINFYLNSFSVRWYERVRRSYSASINKRGVYSIRNMHVSIGDIFGFTFETSPMEDFIEIVVFPELKSLKALSMENNNLQGDNIIKRWIYKDPLHIKGIREYNIEDRMKDIHWKSSLRANRLMVKDYDYTSDREIIIVSNVQCGNPHLNYIDKNAVERTIDISAALASQALNEGVPVGMWTNAQLICYSTEFRREILPSMNSLRDIMELCARMDYMCRFSFLEYITGRITSFNRNTIYVFITPFLDEESAGIITKLKRSGCSVKLIDTSSYSSVQSIEGVETIYYRGEVRR